MTREEKTFYADNRKRFLKLLGMNLALLPSANLTKRNSDVDQLFRQDSNFFYLTGFDEPNASALFGANTEGPFQMFVHPKDKLLELWNGEILGPEVAKKVYGADSAQSSLDDSLEKAFIEAIQHAEKLYYRLGESPTRDQQVLGWMNVARKKLGRTGRPLWPIHDPNEILGELRLIKDPFAVQTMQKAADISAQAHKRAMKITKPGMNEAEIEAELIRDFRALGADRHAYPSIVASGANATVLHYIKNNRTMQKGELLLVDAGAEFAYHDADITRTFPVSGKFSDEQKAVYQAVLEVQKALIKSVKPGITYKSLQTSAAELITDALLKLKVLTGKASDLVKKKAYHPFYPHNISHWLGMDVHDAGRYYENSYDQSRKLAPGMVLTIEPGIYFGAFANGPKKYQGIGIRIEDDILVTDKGHRNLTEAVPKEVEEIEALCAS